MTMKKSTASIPASYYSEQELSEIGFNHIGKNVWISKKSSIYSAETIRIGNNVRIDDFCILSGDITIRNYVHIAAYSALFGKAGIRCDDYSGISSRTIVYSATDDYGGDFITNPTVPDEFRNVIEGLVHLKKHCIIGAGCIILPGVIFGEGAAVGAMSLVKSNLPEWSISFGIPAKPIKTRSNKVLEREQEIEKLMSMQKT